MYVEVKGITLLPSPGEGYGRRDIKFLVDMFFVSFALMAVWSQCAEKTVSGGLLRAAAISSHQRLFGLREKW